ncbi:MAG: hypothetical protein AVDCRST_MAG73-2894 [uncultured Thermomicrobiales bacterium]|uniref:Uncharacterized protein n=1 Tax=uncultured Thermomicrobiales bacterium TaxID=1645740 RepID=A0A6J4UKV8_9BACT|nr:MAG: hypothetical protein AVDCRST_MAG73-2894 [uncultured Thermomicrobiales bacterium]
MVLPSPQTKEVADRIVAIEDDCRRELVHSIQALHEIAMLLTKTNSEVEKLSNRELQCSNRVRDMEMYLDNYGRESADRRHGAGGGVRRGPPTLGPEADDRLHTRAAVPLRRFARPRVPVLHRRRLRGAGPVSGRAGKIAAPGVRDARRGPVVHRDLLARGCDRRSLWRRY